MKGKKEYKLTCRDCSKAFIAFSRKALRCPKCKEEHLRIAAHARYVAKGRNKKRTKRKVPAMTISAVIKALEKYNKEHGTRHTYGIFVSLMERGVINVEEN